MSNLQCAICEDGRTMNVCDKCKTDLGAFRIFRDAVIDCNGDSQLDRIEAMLERVLADSVHACKICGKIGGH